MCIIISLLGRVSMTRLENKSFSETMQVAKHVIILLYLAKYHKLYPQNIRRYILHNHIIAHANIRSTNFMTSLRLSQQLTNDYLNNLALLSRFFIQLIPRHT